MDLPPLPDAGTPAEGYQRGSDGVWRVEYPSLSAMIDRALNPDLPPVDPVNAELRREALADRRSGERRSFFNGYTSDRLRAALDAPPPDIAQAVGRIKAELDAELALPAGRRRRLRRGLQAGDELDPIGWVQRRPDAWSATLRETTDKPVVRLGVNMVVSGYQEPEELLYRGALAAALVDAFIDRGRSVEVLAFESCNEPTSRIGHSVLRVVLKPAHMPMDAELLAFALGEIAVFRVGVMAAGLAAAQGRMSDGWGRPDRLPKADAAALDVVIDHDITSLDAALALARKVADGQCVAS